MIVSRKLIKLVSNSHSSADKLPRMINHHREDNTRFEISALGWERSAYNEYFLEDYAGSDDIDDVAIYYNENLH